MARQPDSFAYHEALDRVRIVSSIAETLLANHAAIVAHPRWKRRVDRALSELAVLHQNIATQTDGKRGK